MRELVAVILQQRSPYIRFWRKGMYGRVYRRMYIIGVARARGANHLEIGF